MTASKHTLISILVILVSGLFSVGCGYGVVKVPTGAMEPTIPTDSYVAWRPIASAGHEVERFDLVIHTVPFDERRRLLGENESSRYIFRVVGLGGEEIAIKDGLLFINGTKMPEPFERVASDDNFGPIAIPEGEYFLLGDNRPASNDSRSWNPSTIRKERIIGEVVWIF